MEESKLKKNWWSHLWKGPYNNGLNHHQPRDASYPYPGPASKATFIAQSWSADLRPSTNVTPKYECGRKFPHGKTIHINVLALS